MSEAGLFGPLAIDGFDFERVLGSGGFADVYVYSQRMPRRRVAVKIMRAAVTDDRARAQFESEANLMAQLSSHPSIVTIHYAAVADNGRPYLVMEYCSKTNLAERYQQRVLTVPEMLQTIVRLCGAVETAHLAGILHRDIKPANVLTTDYGWPALTDFGISVIAGEATIGAGGVSIPWAPPEALGGPGSVDKRSDVYSLAATAYTVLAGHSPFDSAGSQLDMGQFMRRILNDPVPPIGRHDVPQELERMLALAMSKNPDDRPQSASSLARSLQRIEQDMRLPITHMDIPGGLSDDIEGRAAESFDDGDSGSTRIASAADRPQADRQTVTVVEHEPDDSTVVVPTRRPPAPPISPPGHTVDDEVDEATRLRGDLDEYDERTTVSNRAADLDDRTRVVGRTPEVEDHTQVSPGTARGIAIPTTATDVPIRSNRVAYVPAEDAAARVERYTSRSVAPSTPIIRAAPSAPPSPSPLPQTEAVERRTSATKARQGVLVVIAVIGVGLVVLVGAALAAVALFGGFG